MLQGMMRGVILLLVGGTFLGAMMPATRSKMASADPSTPSGAPAKADWGSAAEPLAGSSRSASRRARDWGSANTSSGPITLTRAENGHFFADAQVNGATIHFLVDTGASSIALTQADAARAGVSLTGGSQPIGRGASGVVMGQVVSLRSVQLGPNTGNDVEAMVLEGGEQSLLGQSFLAKFASVEIRGDTMTLR